MSAVDFLPTIHSGMVVIIFSLTIYLLQFKFINYPKNLDIHTIANSVELDSEVCSLIQVCTVCHSVC